ncbi:hypothetical protein [Corallococcus sp. Z5C101001]|uniref:hypothetical protein n=1 Tax=Corallococcus sp. Z5C101001 TaxID=2596829 RepID=UPI00117DF690|nr:hypothetical protein [Corallococcus sp. Z5C101001]TSC25241.1 hypothetical protein FOF48_25260 [Corallococcus sp. Z5C101001]
MPSPSPRSEPHAGRSWLLALLGVMGLTLFALACAALVMVLDFAWSGTGHDDTVGEVLVPPPVYGPLPSFTLRDDRGRALETGQIQGQLTLLQFASEPDARTLQSLRSIQQQLDAEGVSVQVVIAMSRLLPSDEPGPLPPGWRRVWDGARLEATARGLGILAPTDAPTTPAPSSSPLLLVDQRGQVRGAYDLLRAPRTSERLVEDAHCLNTCGPFSVLTHTLKETPPLGRAPPSDRP